MDEGSLASPLAALAMGGVDRYGRQRQVGRALVFVPRLWCAKYSTAYLTVGDKEARMAAYMYSLVSMCCPITLRAPGLADVLSTLLAVRHE